MRFIGFVDIFHQGSLLPRTLGCFTQGSILPTHNRNVIDPDLVEPKQIRLELCVHALNKL